MVQRHKYKSLRFPDQSTASIRTNFGQELKILVLPVAWVYGFHYHYQLNFTQGERL